MRDDFTEEVKHILAARVNYLCSNPDCRAPTTGPQDDPTKAVNVGVAAHITGASAGGPRHNPALSSDERRHSDNGIWLCQNCAKLVDSDIQRFDEKLVRAWRTVAEDLARNSLGKTAERAVAERPSPNLELYLEFKEIKQDTYSPRIPVRMFVVGLKNGVGCGTAKFPSIRYKRACGITVDHFGIDGCYGFGLPRSPSENEWETFRGGSNDVVHPGETLKIAKLIQQGRKQGIDGRPLPGLPEWDGKPISQWAFDAVTFQCEISAEGIPTVTVEKAIPEDVVEWPS
jgi:hypothetical protein